MLERPARIMLLATALLAAAPGVASAQGSDFPQVEQALQTIEQAVERWRAADAALTRSRIEHEELAHRISALKRLREEQRFSQSATLEKLLQQSVTASEQLERQAELRDVRRSDVERRVADAARVINGEVRLLRPGLRTGTKAQQAAVVAKLKALIAARDRATSALARVAGQAQAEKTWAQYDVAIDPLDGPADLREKADFLEDTRDKLRKKIALAEQRLTEARQEQEVARAAQNFSTEVSIFDDRSREARRVPRGEGGAGGGAVLFSSGGPEAASNEDSSAPPPQAPSDPSAGFVGSADREASDPASRASGGSASVGVGPAGAQLPKQLDPNALINLDLTAAGAGEDLRSLESVLANLKQLETYLATRASSIRDRAKRLERDEAKALGVP